MLVSEHVGPSMEKEQGCSFFHQSAIQTSVVFRPGKKRLVQVQTKHITCGITHYQKPY